MRKGIASEINTTKRVDIMEIVRKMEELKRDWESSGSFRLISVRSKHFGKPNDSRCDLKNTKNDGENEPCYLYLSMSNRTGNSGL